MTMLTTRKNRQFRNLILLALWSISGAALAQTNNYAPWVGTTLWGTTCKGGPQKSGPYDYTRISQHQKNLKTVEKHHFSSDVENLIEGQTTSNPLGDIDFVLMVWPNHHRALNTAIRARLRNKDTFRSTRYTPAECYLQRAMNFSRSDGVVRMLYGILLHQMKDFENALKIYNDAETLEPENLQLKYNIGLVLVDLKRFDEAVIYAEQVYDAQLPLPGLKRKLKEQGYWQDSEQ